MKSLKTHEIYKMTSSRNSLINAWCINTDAENHVCYDKQLFKIDIYRKITDVNIITANNEAVSIIRRKIVILNILLDDEVTQVELINVYHCFKIHYNLLSVNQVKAKDYTFKIERNKFLFIHPKDEIVLIGSRVEEGFYYVNTSSNSSKQQFYFIELSFRIDKII